MSLKLKRKSIIILIYSYHKIEMSLLLKLLIIMEQDIIKKLKTDKWSQWDYLKINNNETLTIIYNLLVNRINKLEEIFVLQDPVLCYYYGIYYHINFERKLAKKYYKKAVQYGVSEAMDALGQYHQYYYSPVTKVVKYYLMAIEHNNRRSMFNLGRFYEKLKNYESMVQYYQLASKHSCINSMSRLARYYQRKGNYQSMKVYFIMAIEQGDVDSMYRLGCYYLKIKDYSQMEVYFLMASTRGHTNSISKLINFYHQHDKTDEMIQFYLLAIEKYNIKHVLTKLSKYYQDHLDVLITQIAFYKETNKRKHKYSQLIIKEIPNSVRHFRFRDQSLGMRIVKYHFKLNNGESEDNVYQEIKITDPLLIDYLTIVNVLQVKQKINEYINAL